MLGWGDGFGGAGLELLTAELLLEEVKELRPTQGVGEELAEVEAPTLHTQLRGGRYPVGDIGVGMGSLRGPISPLLHPMYWGGEEGALGAAAAPV